MRPSPVNPDSGKSLSSILGTLVAVAFLVLCAVLVMTKLKRDGKDQPTGGAPASTGGGSAPAGALEISFYTSNAKKTWVDEMVQAFNASCATSGGKAIRVRRSTSTPGTASTSGLPATSRGSSWPPSTGSGRSRSSCWASPATSLSCPCAAH